MKYLILALFASQQLAAQTEIEFVNEFTPETEFVTTTKTVTYTEASFDAPEEFLNRLKSKGIDNPMLKEDTSEMIINWIVGKEKDGEMPIEIKYVETGKPQDGLIRNGESLKGTFRRGEKIKILELPDESRIELDPEMMKNLLGDGFSMDIFDLGTMRVGDSILRTSPFDVPMGKYQISLKIVDRYVLKSIEDGQATFDITSDCVIMSDIPEIGLFAAGGGSGTCVYDCQRMRVRTKNTALRILMSATIMQDVKMKVSMEIAATQSSEFN